MKRLGLFDTYGQTLPTTVKVLCNRLSYAAVRALEPMPRGGWLASEHHWYKYPFPLHGSVLWSKTLPGWFCPEDESSIECMLHLPDYEPVHWVTPGSREAVVDIGSYIGWYAVRAAKQVGPSGRVIALEPDPINRRQLVKNLELNQVGNCTVLPYAAWSKPGPCGWSRGAEPVWHKVDEGERRETVVAVTIDGLVRQLCLSRVDWIKMDIEGGEVAAMSGARQILREFRPVVYVEVHGTLEPLTALLGEAGYVVEKSAFDRPPEHGWILARPSKIAQGFKSL